MRTFEYFDSIYLYPMPIDFRKGINTLSIFIQSQIQISPFSGSLFLFINKKRDGIKAIYWDKTGFALWHKCLEKEKFPWPKCAWH